MSIPNTYMTLSMSVSDPDTHIRVGGNISGDITLVIYATNTAGALTLALTPEVAEIIGQGLLDAVAKRESAA